MSARLLPIHKHKILTAQLLEALGEAINNQFRSLALYMDPSRRSVWCAFLALLFQAPHSHTRSREIWWHVCPNFQPHTQHPRSAGKMRSFIAIWHQICCGAHLADSALPAKAMNDLHQSHKHTTPPSAQNSLPFVVPNPHIFHCRRFYVKLNISIGDGILSPLTFCYLRILAPIVRKMETNSTSLQVVLKLFLSTDNIYDFLT